MRYLDKTRFITDTSQSSNRVRYCTQIVPIMICTTIAIVDHRPLHPASIQDINISVWLLSKTVSYHNYNHAGQGMVHTHIITTNCNYIDMMSQLSRCCFLHCWSAQPFPRLCSRCQSSQNFCNQGVHVVIIVFLPWDVLHVSLARYDD